MSTTPYRPSGIAKAVAPRDRPQRREAAAPAAPAPLRGLRRTLMVLALLAASAVVGGLLSGERALTASGAVTLATVNAILILTRVGRAVEAPRKRPSRAVDIEPTAAWRAGARASVRIGFAIALIAIAVAAVAAGDLVFSVAAAALASGIAVFGGATWLAAVGEEEERARTEAGQSRTARS